MDKHKRDLIVAAVLVGGFFMLAGKNFFPKKTAGPVAAAPEISAPADLSFVGAARQNERARLEQESIWQKDWGRDPFEPQAEVPGVSRGSLTLSGIVWDKRTPLAMINEKVLKVGDVVEGFRILEIRPSSIVLWSENGKTVELELFQSL